VVAEERRCQAAHLGIVAHVIARAEEQIEEIERRHEPSARLSWRWRRVGRLEQGGEVRIGVHVELIETRLDRKTRLNNRVALHAVRI
jgi:hypothetical protein